MKLTFSTKNKVKSPARLIDENNENIQKKPSPQGYIDKPMDNNNTTTMLIGTVGSRSIDINFTTRRTTNNMFEAIKPTRDCNCGK